MKTLFRLLPLVFVIHGYSQAPVPTSWNCDGQPPTGWTHSWGTTGNQFYTSSQQVCEGTSSARLDATGEYIMVNTATQPGRVVYSILGTGTSSPWQGTFKVQESVDGSTWNDLKTYNNSNPLPQSGPCNYDSVLVTNTNVRYVRFHFTNKTSGYNVAVDDITVREPLFANPKIKVEQNSQVLINGGYSQPFNSAVSTTTPINFTLRNASLSTLNISNITITGTNAADFSLAAPSVPTTIPSQGTQTMTINFTPSASGTRVAQINITSDDAYGDNNYVLNLYAIGGNLATEPSAAATNLTFPVNKTYRVVATFNNTTVDFYGGYLVLRSEGAAVSGTPTDGTDYKVGQTIGNAKVVFKGKGSGATTSFWPRWTKANTTYHFAVIPFNGGGSNFVNYRTGDALTGSVTTPASMVSPTEYSTVDPSNSAFISQLFNVVNPHTSIFYSNYRSTMLDGWAIRDTFVQVGPNTFDKVINCVYSGNAVLFNMPFDFTAAGMSREHTFPHSWMPTFPADNPEKPEYNDQHNLFPTIQANVNEARCNYPLGEVVTPIISFGNGKMGLDTAGNRVYEPNDAHKGAAARAMFYMTVCYNGVSGNQWNLNASIGEVCATGPYTINYAQNQQVLKNWHFAYPPNNVDMSRNDYLDSLQGNRNPFVDNPDWVCYIDFSNMTYIANPTIPCTTGVNNASLPVSDNPNVYFTVYPNPSQGQFTVNVYSDVTETGVVKMFDMAGKLLMNQNLPLVQGNNALQVNKELRSGVYLIEVITSNGRSTKRIIIE